MPTTLPPYVLPPLAFPHRRLAALAGRAPIGGAREIALACYLVARLSGDRLAGALGEDAGTARVAGAKAWLASLALPAPVRAPITRCLDLTTTGTVVELATELRALSAAIAEHLEPAARADLDALASQAAQRPAEALPA